MSIVECQKVEARTRVLRVEGRFLSIVFCVLRIRIGFWVLLCAKFRMFGSRRGSVLTAPFETGCLEFQTGRLEFQMTAFSVSCGAHRSARRPPLNVCPSAAAVGKYYKITTPPIGETCWLVVFRWRVGMISRMLRRFTDVKSEKMEGVASAI